MSNHKAMSSQEIPIGVDVTRTGRVVASAFAGTALSPAPPERVIACDAQLRSGLEADDEATLRSLLARLRADCASTTEIEEVHR